MTPDQGPNNRVHEVDSPGLGSTPGRPGAVSKADPHREDPAGPVPIVDMLRRLRLERGWTMQQVADAMGAHKSDVSMWEAGIHIPRFDRMERWADVFGQRLAMLPREPAK